MNSDFHRFLAFLQGPVWLKSIVLQPGEGPFYPKNVLQFGQRKWSVSSWSDPVGRVSQRAPAAVGATLENELVALLTDLVNIC